MKLKKLLLCAALAAVTGQPSAAGEWRRMHRIEKRIVEPRFPDRTFSVHDFGAAGDGTADDRGAIQAAIDSCSACGGGRVVLAAGRYFSRGPVVLKSRVDLHLEAGAVLFFSSDERDYLPVVRTRWEGNEVYNFSPLIYACDACEIAVSGHGTIDGRGSENFAAWKPLQKEDQRRLREQGRQLVPVCDRRYGAGHRLRPALLETVSCSVVRIEGVRFIDAPFWTIHPVACDHVVVRGVTVESTNLNNDGCDPESCRYVLIEGCRFRTGDDGIAIKSGRDEEGRRIGRPTEDVIIRRCTFDTEINGLCIGSELSGGVRNIFAEDLRIERASSALYFKSNLDRGGYIEGVRIRRVQAGRIGKALVRFEPDYKSESRGNHPTRFRDFTIERVRARRVDGYGIDIGGFEALPIRDVTVRRLRIDSVARPLRIRHTRNLRLKRVVMQGTRHDKTID